MPVDHNRNRTIRFMQFWLPVLMCMGIIFFASSIPGNKIPSLFNFQQTAYHLIIYLILALLFSRALKNTSSSISSSRMIIFTIVFGVSYGLSDEFHQAFVPYRSVSGLDVFIDSVGTFVGSLIYRWPR